jgi:S-DNA-T family DNA segregation ATPase FtsK/SpoIIIE
MAKRQTSRTPSQAQQVKEALVGWLAWFKNPLVQQTLAVLLALVALLTATTLLGITSGRWLDAWADGLQLVFGWGVLPVTVGIGAMAAIIILHHLDHPITWRWRPIVGLELMLFSLLALTHLIAGRTDPWGLVTSGWGGGVIGWAISHTLSVTAGPLVTGVLLAILLVLGTGLAFDFTFQDVRHWLQRPTPQPRPRPRPKRTTGRPSARSARPPARRVRTAEPPPSQRAATPAAAPPPAHVEAPAPVARPAAPAPAPSAVPWVPVEPGMELELPTPDLLDEAEPAGLSDEELKQKSRIIVETLRQFGLPVQVVEVRRGPTVTQFGVAPGYTERGGPDGARRSKKVRVSQIASLADDLALALAASSLRVEAPVPGRSVVGIEVPNEEISLVSLRSVMESEEFAGLKVPLAVALGQDIAGEPVVADMGLMPHLLIAGTTGSGKSVCIKALTTCLAMTNRPDDLRMILIDPKMVELVRFNGLPHLLGHTEHDLDRITRVLRWVAHEMDQRYRQFAAVGARNLDDFNSRSSRATPSERLPRIVVFIDELADLMMLAPEQTERTICRIAQMARATGIHLIVATQRPSVDVVTGLIKANFPARISFATASQVDSRVILDMPGAETLLGKGDMLYLAADAGHPVRVQGCFVGEHEAERIVGFWKQQVPQWPREAPWESMMPAATGDQLQLDSEDDDLLQQAIDLVSKRKTISASRLQRALRIGYPRAARLMEQLEELGLVGPQEAAGRPRRVIGGER